MSAHEKSCHTIQNNMGYGVSLNMLPESERKASLLKTPYTSDAWRNRAVIYLKASSLKEWLSWYYKKSWKLQRERSNQ